MKPDIQHIETLIEKYLDAETSIQEEALLKNYFTSDKVADHLKSYQALFGYFSNAKTEKLTAKVKIKSYRSYRKWWMSSVAAGFALMIGGLWYQNYQEQKQVEKALADTKMALELIGKQFQKGDKAIKELKTVDNTTNKVFRTTQTSLIH